ncbi:MAG: hypothetical protein AB7F65_03195 [Dehalococcoidia bacterium]
MTPREQTDRTGDAADAPNGERAERAGARRWRLVALGGLTAVLTLGAVACSDDNGDAEDGDDVPNVSVTPLRPEAEGTGVPRPQDVTGTIPAPTSDAQTPATSGEVTQVIIGDDLAMEDMTLTPGDAIEWINEDDTAHTVASTDGGDWGSGEPVNAELEPGGMFAHQFTTPGEYPLVLDDGDVSWTVTVE